MTLVLGAILVCLLAFGLLRPAPPGATGPRTLPAFDLPLLDGSGRLSDEDLAGSPVVLNLWASWCAPCREEAPALEKTWRRYKSRGVLFVGVDVQDRPGPAKAFVREFGITYPIVSDPEQTVPKALGEAKRLPLTFFIDREGNLLDGEGDGGAATALGTVTEDDLAQMIELLLEEDGADD